MNPRGGGHTALSSDDAAIRKSEETPKLTIVGIGNEFRGDDAAGLNVVRDLRGLLPPEVSVVEVSDDQFKLVELMQSGDSMIIVDAVQSSSPAGTIFRLDAAAEAIPKNFFTFSSHSVDTIQAIELARTIGRLPAKVIIFGISGKIFTYGAESSPEVSEAVKSVVARISGEVQSGYYRG